MTARRLIVVLVLACVGAFVAPSHSAEPQIIQVFDHEFAPEVLTDAVPGAVTWQWAQGTHTVTAYGGATFDSGPRNVESTYTATFNGGLLKYRCTIHSTLSSSGECNGMCGWITDAPTLDRQKPSVTILQPNSLIVVPIPAFVPGQGVQNPVTVSGVASDDSAVYGVGIRVYDVLARVKEYPMSSCTGCGTEPSVTWSLTVSFLPGTYVVEAVAADTTGNTQTSRRVSFVVV